MPFKVEEETMYNNHYGNRMVYTNEQSLWGVYGWMSVGLIVTAIVSAIVVGQPQLMMYLVKTPLAFWGIFALQFGLVMVLSTQIQRLSFSAGLFCFLAYAALTGLNLSVLGLVYTHASLVTTFGASSLMFGVMALYGYMTESDLSDWGSVLLMGLVGLIIAGIINVFTQNPVFELVIAAIGVFVFALLTAYDVQRIKTFLAHELDAQSKAKITLLGALSLYLNFINIFLYMLQFLGKKRE